MPPELPKKALVIEDSPSDRLLMKQILTGLGYTVTETTNGTEGFQAISRSGPFSVALVDWNMSGMTGIDLVKAVRANPLYKTLRIVMVTSENEMDNVRAALLSGADEYIMKPFSREMVNIKLKMLGMGG
jgi:two-component system, chemotaxis family, chemotaxis protein CheY